MSQAPSGRARAAVVVVAWRASPQLPACLASLAGQDLAHEVVVVLNAPTPGRLEELERTGAAEGATVIASAVNLGFPGACNLGATRSSAPYLVFLNDDCVVRPGWLAALVEAAEAHPEAGAVGSRLLAPDGTLEEAGAVVFADGTVALVGHGAPGDGPAFAEPRVVDYCSAASLLVRRASFEAVGGFDEGYFPGYYEDVDLCLRLAAAGQVVRYEPGSVAEHRRGSSSHPRYQRFLAERHRRRLLARWGPTLKGRHTASEDESAVAEAARLAAIGRPATASAQAVDSGDAPAPTPELWSPEDPTAYLRAELALRDAYAAELEGDLEALEERLQAEGTARALLEEDQARLRAALEGLEAQRASLAEGHDAYARAYADLKAAFQAAEEERAALGRRLAEAEGRLGALEHRLADRLARLPGLPAARAALARRRR